MRPQDDFPLKEPEQDHLSLYLYTIPVVGFFPALWTLYYRRGTQQQNDLSRAVVMLTLSWLIVYVLLGISAENADAMAVKLWLANSVVTSGYFVANVWLMVQVWRRKSLRIPFVSQLGDRLP